MQHSNRATQVLTRAPHPRLAPFVQRLLVVEYRNGCHDTHLPDTGLVAALRLRGECAFDYAGASPIAALTGLFDRVRRHAHSRDNLMALVAFTPTGAAAFTRVPLDELANTTVPLADVVDDAKALPRLLEQLATAANHPRRLDLLERFLLAHLQRPRLDPLVAAAVKWLENAAPDARIDTLVAHIGLSQSALERRFRRAVGVSPKRFASLVRLQRVVRLCRDGLPLTTVAHAAGYFDQPHFIHDFQRIAGVAPEAYFSTMPSMAS